MRASQWHFMGGGGVERGHSSISWGFNGTLFFKDPGWREYNHIFCGPNSKMSENLVTLETGEHAAGTWACTLCSFNKQGLRFWGEKSQRQITKYWEKPFLEFLSNFKVKTSWLLDSVLGSVAALGSLLCTWPFMPTCGLVRVKYPLLDFPKYALAISDE